jgi:hypothetical protein
MKHTIGSYLLIGGGAVLVYGSVLKAYNNSKAQAANTYSDWANYAAAIALIVAVVLLWASVKPR